MKWGGIDYFVKQIRKMQEEEEEEERVDRRGLGVYQKKIDHLTFHVKERDAASSISSKHCVYETLEKK